MIPTLAPTLTTRGGYENRNSGGSLVVGQAMRYGGIGKYVEDDIVSTMRLNSGNPTSTDLVVHSLAENQRVAFHLTQTPISSDEIAPTISVGSSDHGQATVGVAFPLAMRGRANGAEMEVGPPDIYNTLRAANGGSSLANQVLTPELAVRRLTPRECERLMSWPDDWTQMGVNASGKTYTVPDSGRYAMCGNGVVSNVAEWIGHRLASKERP